MTTDETRSALLPAVGVQIVIYVYEDFEDMLRKEEQRCSCKEERDDLRLLLTSMRMSKRSPLETR